MNPFSISEQHPALTLDADPKAYIALGREVRKGERGYIMSRGELVRFSKNPWKWVKSEPVNATSEMQWGSVVDCMALTPSRFKDQYEVCPETYPTADGDKPWNWNASFCKNWRRDLEATGKEPIKLMDLEEARIAHSRLMEDPLIAALFSQSKTQVQCVVEYCDKDTGLKVLVKTLLDLVPNAGSEHEKFIADLKTTKDASVYEWEKSVFHQGYHVQSAMYLDAYNAATGEDRSGFLHVVQESAPPYAVGRRMLGDDFLELGRQTYQSALKFYCQCLEANKWPGFDDMNDNSANPIIDGWRITSPSSWMVS